MICTAVIFHVLCEISPHNLTGLTFYLPLSGGGGGGGRVSGLGKVEIGG